MKNRRRVGDSPHHGPPNFTPETVDAARRTIAHLLNVLALLGEVPTDTSHWNRELVSAALFRRSIALAQSIGSLAINGQVEACVILMRSLTEVGLSLRLVLADQTDRMAKRLVGQDYRFRREYHAKALDDPSTRATIEGFPGEKDRYRSLVRSWRDQFQSPFFDDVRDELDAFRRENKGWHGFRTIGEAFASLNESHDYYRQYNGQSPFVHGTNLEWDWAEAQPDNTKPGGFKPILRSMFEPSADRMRPHLALALYRTFENARLIIDDRLNAPPIIGATENQQRKQVLRDIKVDLIQLRMTLNEVFGPEPPDDAQVPESK